MKTMPRLFIALALFCSTGFVVYADGPSSSLDDKPSVDSASSGVQVPAVDAEAASQTRSSYLYDLKNLIDRSRENIKEVNDKIKQQAVLKRNQEREERAHEYYQKGEELTKAGKLEEARDYFEKAIRITEHPEMAGYIEESERRLRRQEAALRQEEHQHYNQIKKDEHARREEVEGAYKDAIELYRQKKYPQARDAFNHVGEIAPDYRATSSYLKIIDQYIVLADAQAMKQRAAEAARQQQEAETAQAKEKTEWLRQIQDKERARDEQVRAQAEDNYRKAVKLFNDKKYAEAKKKFQEISWVVPDYKETMRYLHRIDEAAKQEQEHAVQAQRKSLDEERWQDLVASKKEAALRQHEMALKEEKHKQELAEQAQFLYTAAIHLYDTNDLDGAWAKFGEIEKLCPDFKSTRDYIARIEKQDARFKVLPSEPPPAAAVPAAASGVSSAVVSGTSPASASATSPAAATASAFSTGGPPLNHVIADESLQGQQHLVQDLTEMDRRVKDLYNRVSALEDNKATLPMKRKMGEVDRILSTLKEAKQRVVQAMLQQQMRQRQAESMLQQQKQKAEAEQVYEEAVREFNDHDYQRAQTEFTQLENIVPDYKSAHSYLNRMNKIEGNAFMPPTPGNKQNAAQQIKEWKQREQTQEESSLRRQKEEKHNLEIQEQEILQKYADKVSAINDEIIRLSQMQDYQGMKAKFIELEQATNAMARVEESMGKTKAEGQYRQEVRRRQEHQPPDIAHYRDKEIKEQQDSIYAKGIDLYRQKRYVESKLLFIELSSLNDRRAQDWVKKNERAIIREVSLHQEREAKKRSSYIEEQMKARHRWMLEQEHEAQRRKQMAQEMERKKKEYEQRQTEDKRKEEATKAHERERLAQEAKLLQSRKEEEKQDEKYRFHHIGAQTSAAPASLPSSDTTAGLSSLAAMPVVSTPQDLEARRKAVRKELEDGVEMMYKQALSLYDQGNFTAAADKFKDIEDVLPGYKRTQEFMHKARQRTADQGPPPNALPVSSHVAAAVPAAPVAAAASSPVSRQDAISKTLDLFDSNVK